MGRAGVREGLLRHNKTGSGEKGAGFAAKTLQEGLKDRSGTQRDEESLCDTCKRRRSQSGSGGGVIRTNSLDELS